MMNDIQSFKTAVMLLDLFTKEYCRDYSVTDDLKFRCGECPFDENDICRVKQFKSKYMPDYKEFGSMGDLQEDV